MSAHPDPRPNSESAIEKFNGKDRLYGVFLVVLSAVSFGTMAIFARLAYAAGSDPVTVLFLRFTVAAVIMLGIMAVKGAAFPRGRTLATLVLMGAIGYVGLSFAFFAALTMISAGLAAILLYLYPAFVTLLAVLFLKKPMTTFKLLALSFTFGGTVLIVGPDGENGQVLGVVLAISSAVLYSIYIVIGSKVLVDTGAFSASTVVIISAAVVFGGIVAFKGVQFPATATGWLSALAIALVSTAFAFVTFFSGLRRIDPANAAMISTLEPVITVLLAAVVLGETLTMFKILGGMMILFAVVILAKNEAVRR